MASKASLIAKAFGGGGAFSKIADRTLAADSRKLSKNAMAAGATGMQTFADMAGLIAHTGMSNGDQALVTGLNKIFVYSVSGWFLIATVTNSTPTDITGVNGAYDLAIDGTATVITVASTDPEGFPLTFSSAITTGSLTNGGGATATVVQGTGASKNVFTITPSTVEAYEGSFSITFSATDGTNGAVNAVSAFTLAFWTQAISTVSGMATAGVSGNYNYWYSSHASSSNANNYMTLSVAAGQTFYIGMVGAGGGGSGRVSGDGDKGGIPGYSNATVVVPAGVTTMTVWTGAGGTSTLGGTGAGSGGANHIEAGGLYGGGSSGRGRSANYGSGACSGGGLVGLFTGAFVAVPSQANGIAVVGSGGGGAGSQGSTPGVAGLGGFGGSFDDKDGGAGGWSGTSYPYYNGQGGTATAGGAGATYSNAADSYRAPAAGHPASEAGTALNGGDGGESQYDPGAGGGAGWFGGGGGAGGGGYSAGASGGGSGYLKSGTVVNNATYSKAGNDYTDATFPQHQVVAWAEALMGVSSVLTTTAHGRRGAPTADGGAGWAIVICTNAA